MNYKQLIRLPKDCKKFLNQFKQKQKSAELLKEVFDFLKVGGKLKIKYSLETSNNFQKVKLPTEVWKTKSGHCYELSLFLLACLKYLNFKAYYCEMPNFKYGDHACVLVKMNRKNIFLDPSRKIFNAKYKNYQILNEKELVGNYYINCAFMFYPWEWTKKKLTIKEKIKLSKKSIRYAKLGLKYYSNSKRGREIINRNLKFLSALGNNNFINLIILSTI